MIIYSDIVRRENVPFDEYLRIPGYSQSFLKNEINGLAPGVDVTDNMRLGSMVDAILTESADKVKYTSSLFPVARSIALDIKRKFGSVLDQMEKQASYTAKANYNGFQLAVKGRLDLLLPTVCVIDLKVTTCKPAQFFTLIEYMGYDKQLWHYGKLAQVQKGYLLIYSRPVKNTFLITMDISKPIDLFWADKIEKHGELIAA